MRIAFFTVMFTLALLIVSPTASATSDIYEVLDASAPGESIIVMEYLWVYGIVERVEIRGDGLLRAERHVHDTELFNRLHEKLAEKGDLSPYGWEIYSMEEGDYDFYWVAEISPESYKELIEILADSGFPDIDDTYGDWEVWSITLQAGETEARVGQVLRDWHAGFEVALDAIEELAGIAKTNGEVDPEVFIEWFDESSNSIGGAS